jgi:arylsulfatase A-like enzyme
MGRKILFVTTDQQRYDAIGCNGGQIARTPVIDQLARDGVVYRRAYNQNTVCMPSRSTMLSGQYPRTHGVTMNGIPLPIESPNIAALLRDQAGYNTALIGKAHFEPSSAPDQNYFENYAAGLGQTGPHRGFERMELAAHTGRAGRSLYHYPKWLADNHPDSVEGFFEYIDKNNAPSARGGGDTGAPQIWSNPIPREIYHTDWVADRAIDWLDSLDNDADWFLWLSFPDPHHPWDPPQSELARVDWRDLDLPEGYPGGPDRCAEILGRKPRHWLDWYEGKARFSFAAPPTFVGADLTPDQIREVNAVTHVENELIDEALGRVMNRISTRGWDNDTDVVFTTDHGEMQGDFGMLFKGAFHVDALMRAPLIWRPAPSAGVEPVEIAEPVGHIDLAPTFAAIGGIDADPAFQGTPLPVISGSAHERAIVTWDDTPGENAIRMTTLCRDGYICTQYGRTGYYEGVEGELYDVTRDPHQWENLWNDPASATLKSDLLADLRDHAPVERETPLVKVARV